MRKPPGYWAPEKVDEAFDEMKDGLGRMPYQKEFPSGALTCIKQGRYKKEVRTWGRYLEHRNSKPANGRYVEDRRIGPTVSWTNGMLDQAFDDMIDKLGRTPNYKEFEKKHPGAMSFIRGGKYDKKISKWNQYVEHRNSKPNTTSWDSERMDKAFDEMKTELGRTPTVTEFSRKYGGALDNIYDGRYNQNIRTWVQYLEHRGIKQEVPIKTPDQLQTLFEQEPIARLVAERFGQPEDVADIMAVIYSDRIPREDLFDLMERPSLRDYLGKIRKTD
ncbi:MAG TPA: hypothetical protein ACFYEL_09650, partial [Candidatus Wunengus californicus]|uniref:hypothetical protein n=1 Tax=Candidatus Wunengus californicus TaxID=3367619 RepID=UPI0040254278